MHSDDKWYVENYKVYMNLIWLNGEVGTGAGDVAGGAEYKPTAASLEVLDGIEKDLAAAKAAFTAATETDVPAFNKAGARRRARATRRAALTRAAPRIEGTRPTWAVLVLVRAAPPRRPIADMMVRLTAVG